MKISIFGMGYVGCVTAACLMKQGHSIIGVDVIKEKVEVLNKKRWPIFEPGLDDLARKQLSLNRLEATNDEQKAIDKSQISIICVGTPGQPDGNVDLNYLKRTCINIGKTLERKKKRHIILIRSTVPPGTTESFLMPLFGNKKRENLEVGYYPEFLREGSAIRDFFNPGLNLLGCSNKFPSQAIKDLLPQIRTPLTLTSIKVAEAIKYANNIFHACKIAFVNEFSLFCKQFGVDSEEVMKIFCKDKKLNLSSYYLNPGFSFGGSCLPKEARTIIALSKKNGINPILFEAILNSNNQMIERLIALIYKLNPACIGYFGISFKPDTDDIRESPILRTIEMLLSSTSSYSKKIKQIIFDNQFALSKIRGKYQMDLELAESPEVLIKKSKVIVLGPLKINNALESQIIISNKPVIDLKWHKVGTKLRNYSKYYSLL